MTNDSNSISVNRLISLNGLIWKSHCGVVIIFLLVQLHYSWQHCKELMCLACVLHSKAAVYSVTQLRIHQLFDTFWKKFPKTSMDKCANCRGTKVTHSSQHVGRLKKKKKKKEKKIGKDHNSVSNWMWSITVPAHNFSQSDYHFISKA